VKTAGDTGRRLTKLAIYFTIKATAKLLIRTLARAPAYRCRCKSAVEFYTSLCQATDETGAAHQELARVTAGVAKVDPAQLQQPWHIHPGPAAETANGFTAETRPACDATEGRGTRCIRGRGAIELSFASWSEAAGGPKAYHRRDVVFRPGSGMRRAATRRKYRFS
jgi:hypothetical protein